MAFEFTQLSIPEVIAVQPRRFHDPRGFFAMSYRQSVFQENGIPESFVQDNISSSSHGVLRGLHFQKNPCAQGKLVQAVQGKIFDVAVDLRKGSPTYGQWDGETLDSEKGNMLYIPPGFAHGFCVLSATCLFTYKVTAEYAPATEGGILWNDPTIGIKWPLDAPLLSDRDAALPLLGDADFNF